MKKFINLKNEIYKYLSFDHSPTIVGMQDDGLSLLKSSLIADNKKSKDISFVGINLAYIEDISVKTIEDEINNELARDNYPGDTITQTNTAGYKVVAIVEDILVTADLDKAIESCDALIKKYQGKLQFVYLVEHANLLSSIENHASHNSSIIDAVTFFCINSDWNKQNLSAYCKLKYITSLTPETIDNISLKSNNHFGIFTRMYRDTVLGSNHLDRYLENIVEEFNEVEISTFKKLANKTPLDLEELKVEKAYRNVGFIDMDGIITIP